MEEFFMRMAEILSADELEIFRKEYDKPACKGIRVNTLKCSLDKLKMILPIADNRTPFCREGVYIDSDSQISGNHPIHHAGAFYFQEPSAMSAVSVLSPKPGDRVLDLCAAPGGKSTQIASALCGEGLLWSNEIVRNRATILMSNIERCGVSNAVVSSSDPESLCAGLSGFFDKVLVDAPCSGEGMFRRDPGAKDEWSPEHSDSCAVRQLKILESAKKALRPSGVLVYSTCTFSYAENEGVILEFLRNNPDFELVDCEEKFGRRTLDGLACRIFPMDGGEGHFAAKLRKRASEYTDTYKPSCAPYTPKDKIPDVVKDFLLETFFDVSPYSRLMVHSDKVYALPEGCPEFKGLGVIRAGVLVGEIKKNYFEPAHALYMSAEKSNLRRVLELSLEDERVGSFLRGEEIPAPECEKGYNAVLVEGMTLGFGKVSGGRLKNKYPKGLRIF